jgi:hypothetical protein
MHLGRRSNACRAEPADGFAVQADGRSVITIEGIGTENKLDPMQEAFWNEHGLQCGFCTPGMILTAKQLLADNPNPSDAEIRHGLEGNLCRCTGYQSVVQAVQYAVKKNSSPVKMIIDTPCKQMYENRVKLLIAGDVDRLVDEHYNEDAVLVSFEFTVKGREALRAHFHNFVKWVKIKEVLSTDHFTETENSFFYEATAMTNYGVGRVYDAYHLRDDKIAYHFTGVIK